MVPWVWSALLRASCVGTEPQEQNESRRTYAKPRQALLPDKWRRKDCQTEACKYSKYKFYLFPKLSGCRLCQNVLWVSSDLECSHCKVILITLESQVSQCLRHALPGNISSGERVKQHRKTHQISPLSVWGIFKMFFQINSWCQLVHSSLSVFIKTEKREGRENNLLCLISLDYHNFFPTYLWLINSFWFHG